MEYTPAKRAGYQTCIFSPMACVLPGVLRGARVDAAAEDVKTHHAVNPKRYAVLPRKGWCVSEGPSRLPGCAVGRDHPLGGGGGGRAVA